MATTKDNVVFDFSDGNEMSVIASKPFLKKELIYIIDQNGSSDYSRNQVVFETLSIANNGRYADYKDGFVSFPLHITLASDTDFATGADVNLRSKIEMKGSNLNVIDSVEIQYNNETVVQTNPNLTPYLIFKQHSTYSMQDEMLNKHSGYRKDTNMWKYDNVKGLGHIYEENVFDTFQNSVNNDVLSQTNLKEKGENVKDTTDAKIHHYFYDCIVPLKHLPFFDKMPLVRGANIKMTFNLNQGQIVYSNAGVVSNSFKGSIFPVMRLGSTEIGHTEMIDVKVCGGSTKKSQCRLYLPVYTLNQQYEKNYITQQKKLVYEDFIVKHIRELSGQFNELITNSITRVQGLLIVPVLSGSDKGNDNNGSFKLSPLQSPFTTEPATCSPYYMTNFNVKVSGLNVYANNKEFGYEQYLDELNGNMGLNANTEVGSTSSMISLKDWNSNFGYIYVDLSRRQSSDDYTPINIEIQGNLQSGKKMDFLVYVSYLKDLSIDLATGQRVV
jgi:hypothetical protein